MNVSGLRRVALDSASIASRAWPLLAIGLLVDAAFIFVFLIALQAFLPEEFGASDAIAGYTLAAFGLAKLALQVGGGVATDRLGVRRSLVIGTGSLLTGYLAMALLAHAAVWLIIGCGALVGFGSAVTWPALYAAGAAKFRDQERGRFTSLLTLATGGALVLGAGGGALLNRMVRFDVAIIAPITAVAIALMLTPLAGAAAAVRDDTESRFSVAELKSLVSGQRAAFALVVLANGIALGALTAAFRAYGRDVLGVSLARQALMLAPAALLGGLLVVPGGVLADRMGARRLMAPGYAVVGAAVVALAMVDQAPAVIVLSAVAGAAYGLAVPTIASTMMALAGGKGRRGGVLGWFMMVDGMGHALGPAVAGLLLGVSGASAVLMLAGAMFVLVGYVALATRGMQARPAPVIAVGEAA
ncbi:MAG: MFS transporter [Chloroflexi bacterium]|nr:MFS transporter [Chloroflexota bacterium]